jgi:hypothetical protein
MAERSSIWQKAIALFGLINFAGAGWAFVQGERPHELVHGLLFFISLAAYLALRFRGSQPQPHNIESDDRVAYLQQSVDALALEVERLGEKQRYSERLGTKPPDNNPPKEP